MTDWQRILAGGAMINSALYLTGVFVAGLVLANGLAWRMALASAGFTYLSYFVQLARPIPNDLPGGIVTGISIVLGAAAGLVLLV